MVILILFQIIEHSLSLSLIQFLHSNFIMIKFEGICEITYLEF